MKKIKQYKKGIKRYNYNGIEIFADVNVHEQAYSFIKDEKKDSKILILGAGVGSFDQRLLDNGFKNITSVDLYSDNYKIIGTKFIQYDLNKDFGKIGKFDTIICIEVIEHIENIYHFFRNITELFSTSSSKLILTTPNIHTGISRLSFLKNNFLSGFTNNDLYDTGHINPIFQHLLDYNIVQNNLFIIDKIYNKKVYEGYTGLKYIIYYLFSKLLKIIFKAEEGAISIYHIGKK